MAKTYKCRRCKAPLVRSEHIVFSHFEDSQQMIPGSDPPRYQTVPESVYKHVPCSSCGDPKPLATIAANLPTLIFLFVVFALIFGGGYAIIFL